MLTESESGVRQDISAGTLKLWSYLLKTSRSSLSANTTNEDIDGLENTADYDGDDSDDGNEFTALQPQLAFMNSFSEVSMANFISRVGSSPSLLHITLLITEMLPLNSK